MFKRLSVHKQVLPVSEPLSAGDVELSSHVVDDGSKVTINIDDLHSSTSPKAVPGVSLDSLDDKQGKSKVWIALHCSLSEWSMVVM